MRYGQNVRQQREAQKVEQAAAGLISERYAGIAGIDFRLTYYHRSATPVLMVRTLSFLPADYAHFQMRCEQDGCTGGGYDLGPVVAGLAKAHRRSAKGTLFCHGSNGRIGHGSIAYEITIQYRPRSA
jgi:hypothetical protein